MLKEMRKMNLQLFGVDDGGVIVDDEDYDISPDIQKQLDELTGKKPKEVEDPEEKPLDTDEESNDDESEDEEETELDVDETADDEDADDEEDTDEEDTDEEDEPDEEVEVEEEEKKVEEEKMVTLAALHAERRKHKERIEQMKKDNETSSSLAKKIKELTGLDETTLMKNLETVKVQELMGKGLSEAEAKVSIQKDTKLAELEAKFKKMELDNKVKELKGNRFYSGLEDNLDDILENATNKGLTLEQSYFDFMGNEKMEEKINELQKKAERVANAKKKIARKGNIKPGTPAKSKRKVDKKTSTDMSFLKEIGVNISTKELEKYKNTSIIK